MAAVLAREAPAVPLIHLFNDVPPFDARGAAYLLSAYTNQAKSSDVVIGVVDPGVGTSRLALAVLADGVWYVGPDNGLFAMVTQRAHQAEMWEIRWRPETLSNSFHGRDLFAPAAALFATRGRDALGRLKAEHLQDIAGVGWPAEHDVIVYFDRFGNAITGRRAEALRHDVVLEVCGRKIIHAFTFGEVPPGEAFWYENSNGLVEIAVNQGNAQVVLGASIGTHVRLLALGDSIESCNNA